MGLIGVRVELIYAKSASSARLLCASSYLIYSMEIGANHGFRKIHSRKMDSDTIYSRR